MYYHKTCIVITGTEDLESRMIPMHANDSRLVSLLIIPSDTFQHLESSKTLLTSLSTFH